MASLDELKDRIKSEAEGLWEKVSQTGAYHRLSNRYENLSPNGQKLMLGGGILLGLLLIFSIPLGSFWSSSDSMSTFENRRDLIHSLFKAAAEVQSSTGLTAAPPLSSLQGRINSELESNLILPEQIKSITIEPASKLLPPESVEGGLSVSLMKLNLRQVIDIGAQIQGIASAIKITDMDIRANAQDSRYMDVVYKLVALKVPNLVLPPAEPDPDAPTRGAKGASKKTQKSSDE